MEEQKATIPYYVHEGEIARQERHIKRLWILCIIIFVAFVATTAGWIIYASQHKYYVITQDVGTGLGSAYVTGTGNINCNDAEEGNTNS